MKWLCASETGDRRPSLSLSHICIFSSLAKESLPRTKVPGTRQHTQRGCVSGEGGRENSWQGISVKRI